MIDVGRPVRESNQIDSGATPKDAIVGRSFCARGAGSVASGSVASGTKRSGCRNDFSLIDRVLGTTAAVAARETVIHTRTAADRLRAVRFMTLLLEGGGATP